MKYTAKTFFLVTAACCAAITRRDYALAILQNMAAGMTATIEVLKEDPVFQTGHARVDTFLAGGLYVALLCTSYIVLRELLEAWLNASRAENAGISRSTQPSKSEQESQPRRVRWRAVKVLLLSAVLILVVVHTLRFKHRSIKLSSFKLKQELGDTQTAFKRTRDFGDYLPDGNDVKSKAYTYAYGKLPDWLVEKIPWLPHDWSRNASVWSHFRLLIDESRRNWWTRQWVMGWSAWAVFVVIESKPGALKCAVRKCYGRGGSCWGDMGVIRDRRSWDG